MSIILDESPIRIWEYLDKFCCDNNMISAPDKNEKNGTTERRLLLMEDREMKDIQKSSGLVLSAILGQSSFHKTKREDPRDKYISRRY